ncbi:MAG: hypothetical protein ACE14V_07175 [bacterium]
MSSLFYYTLPYKIQNNNPVNNHFPPELHRTRSISFGATPVDACGKTLNETNCDDNRNKEK